VATKEEGEEQEEQEQEEQQEQAYEQIPFPSDSIRVR
jgi:hypothetical protein